MPRSGDGATTLTGLIVSDRERRLHRQDRRQERQEEASIQESRDRQAFKQRLIEAGVTEGLKRGTLGLQQGFTQQQQQRQQAFDLSQQQAQQHGQMAQQVQQQQAQAAQQAQQQQGLLQRQVAQQGMQQGGLSPDVDALGLGGMFTRQTPPAPPTGMVPSGWTDPATGTRYQPPREPTPVDPALQATRIAGLQEKLATLERDNQIAPLLATEAHNKAYPTSPLSFGGYTATPPNPFQRVVGMRQRPPQPTVPTTDTSFLRRQLDTLQQAPTSGLLAPAPTGQDMGSSPHPELPDPFDASLGDNTGNTEGAQYQTSDGAIYEIQQGQWVRIQ